MTFEEHFLGKRIRIFTHNRVYYGEITDFILDEALKIKGKEGGSNYSDTTIFIKSCNIEAIGYDDDI